MAWRDSRRSRGRLLLFLSAIVLGIAALVAINGFGDNLARSIDEQARELVGADLVLSAPQPFTAPLSPALGRRVRARSEEVAFASLVQFPRGEGVRLAQVRALTGGFPYYGDWLVEPREAVAAFRRAGSEQRLALVDDALLLQFNARVGDSIKVGRLRFLIAGRVTKTPGQSGLNAALAPTVFIPRSWLAATGLQQRGSRLQYRQYFQLSAGTPVDRLLRPLQSRLDEAGIDADTVSDRQRQTGRAFGDLTRFLSLVAFVALLLGCVGVASAVNLYVRDKIAAVAVLRCLGASGRQALLIYLLQTAVMGLLGAALGAALGTGLQWLLPRLLADFLPVGIRITVSWPAVLQGLLSGLLVAVLFALLPLLAIRRVSPLRTLRGPVEEEGRRAPDPLWLGVYGLIGLLLLGFAYWQTREIKLALGFVGGLLLAFGALAGLAAALRYLVRRHLPTGGSFVLRQGLANLYRPNNQTITLTVAVGLGVLLLAVLFLLQGLLLGRVELAGGGRQPNLVLFDIQPGQRAGVQALLREQRLPVLQQVPVVTMRLQAINHRPASFYQQDSSRGVPRWAFRREYRVTYRNTLISSEKLAAGRPPTLEADGRPRISLEEGFFRRLKLQLGDTLTFNVQGLPLETIVSGTRTVDWTRVQTNFIVLFPAGVLEPAPQFYVLMSRVPDNAALGAVQRALVQRFPNVSAIDLALILRTVDDILDRIAVVIRFMAFFSMGTGLLVLASAVVVSRYQRARESVLLRTLGAARRQVLLITLVEYAVLGWLAALTGLLLAGVAGWALAYWVFEVPFRPDPLPLLALALTTTLLTVIIGLLNSRAVLTRPPLEVLRSEAV
ncbi:ABC transporter permease [Solirubrum puertoriconensis]|uniref:ABC transporter permease n=1 Tax=Solirubrum puertoriconensis TaxID=1751427 RepID=A0A9X0HND0_SOLP1|nr:FtsX-like permease family protein [Solirubrum puertoriconensis]KUG09197.1 ABC transporter permease [Solirubrum puertoriconensis]